MCPGRVRGGTQGRVEARPAWGNYRMPTGEAGTEEGGPTSLLLLGKFSQGVVEVEGGGVFPRICYNSRKYQILGSTQKIGS